MENYNLTESKGILSLLSAIEQTGDTNLEPDNSPGKMIDKDSLSEENFIKLQNQLNLETLEMSGDINLQTFSCCAVCGQSSSEGSLLVDIYVEIEVSGEKSTISSVLQELIALTPRAPGLVCVECAETVEHILQLRARIKECLGALKTRHDDWTRKKAKFPSVSDYTSVLELKMPLNIFNMKEDESLNMSPKEGSISKKSKLQILAETLEHAEEDKEATDVMGDDPEVIDQLNKENEEIGKVEADSVVASCEGCGMKLGKTSRRENLCTACVKESAPPPPVKRPRVTKTAEESTPVSCPKCEKSFKSKHSMKEHYKLKHLFDGKAHQCMVCPETFSSKHGKIVHERTHKGEKSIRCEDCGAGFQTYQALQHHRSKHTGEFSYHCESCGKGFNNFKLLEEHYNLHTGDKPYACQECNKSFANRGSLWLHRKKHENSKPYVCDYCAKEFGHSSHLAVHKRMHTGETPYKCRFCDEGFISGNHLKRHMRTHQNEQPFACGICKQEFGKRSDFVKHCNVIHNGKVVNDTANHKQLFVSHQKATAINEPALVVSQQQQPSKGREVVPLTAAISATPHQPSTLDQQQQQQQQPLVVTAMGQNEGEEAEKSTTTPEYCIEVGEPGSSMLQLDKLEGEAGEYVIPVSLLVDQEQNKDDQTIVFVLPH